MPRQTRVTEAVMRQSPPTLRSSRLSDNRSPRGTQSHPLNQKKLSTRIAVLESQLGLAQQELKSLKGHLVLTDSAKTGSKDEENDVFEVTVDKKHSIEIHSEEENKPKSSEDSLSNELALKNDEMESLKRSLDEKAKELEGVREENSSLKMQLDERSTKISSAQSEIDELKKKLNEVSAEVEKSKSSGVEMNEKLQACEKAKEDLEREMKRVRVQTEQWRKAADAAASVLAGRDEMNGRRLSERCGSMDKIYGGGGYSYVIDDSVDVFGSEKRKGIRMFGDLWKRKGQK